MQQLGDQLGRALPCALLAIEAGGRIRSASRLACAWTGRAERDLVGMPLEALLCETEAGEGMPLPAFDAASSAMGRPDWEGERALRGSEGQSIPVWVRIALGGPGGDSVCALSDLRETKALEFKLGRSQQLESVGRIAAGIAHEINTPVQFIGDSVSFLREAFADLNALLELFEGLRAQAAEQGVARELREKIAQLSDEADLEFLREEVPASLERTLEGVSRVAEIARAIKEFSYPEQREKEATDLNAALRSTLTIARNEYKYLAEIEADFGELPPVFCHAGHMNQVFLNLIINAAHAIEQKEGESGRKGVIRIATRTEGETVLITISDTGCGIPEDIQARVFDAFFTTKEVGKGTGQGLALARSVIVEKHGGTISLDSRVGEGTRFRIRVPIDGRGQEQSHP